MVAEMRRGVYVAHFHNRGPEHRGVYHVEGEGGRTACGSLDIQDEPFAGFPSRGWASRAEAEKYGAAMPALLPLNEVHLLLYGPSGSAST